MTLPATVGVIGGGLMGAGIARVFAAAGAGVIVVERDPTAARAAMDRIRAGVEESARRGKLTDTAADVMSRVVTTIELAELAGAELVIEAVPEQVAEKLRVLAAAESVVGDDTVLATNTSALSIGELATALRQPERFLGMHFFNPVPASKLVELIIGPATAAPVRERAVSCVRALGKTDVVVRDSPGFATSRLGVLLGLEAIRMLEEDVAEPDAIDRAMELGYRHPMGPLRLTDLVGLDVRLAIAEYLATALGDRFAPPRLLRDKVARGELGRKTGVGFYTWN